MRGTKAQTTTYRFAGTLGTKRIAHRRGFSFAEVMFAVIVLGIGFIMIAAIFPVAIGQTQLSLSDTAGVTVGRSGSIYMSNLIAQQGAGTISPMGNVVSYANAGTLSAPGGDGLVHPIDGPIAPDPLALTPLAPPTRWDRLKGNFIDTADARFAWIPIGYKMADETVSSFGNQKVPRYAEFYLLAVQAQVNPTFDHRDYDTPGTPGAAPFDQANLRPKLITGVNIQDNNPTYGVDTVTFPNTQPTEACVAPGAYILISNDHLTGTDAKIANGLYYRIGSNLAPNVWELQPGNDFTPIPRPGPDALMGTPDDTQLTTIPMADVLIVGKGFNDPSQPTQFEGAAMDLFMLPPVIVQLPIVQGP